MLAPLPAPTMHDMGQAVKKNVRGGGAACVPLPNLASLPTNLTRE